MPATLTYRAAGQRAMGPLVRPRSPPAGPMGRKLFAVRAKNRPGRRSRASAPVFSPSPPGLPAPSRRAHGASLPDHRHGCWSPARLPRRPAPPGSRLMDCATARHPGGIRGGARAHYASLIIGTVAGRGPPRPEFPPAGIGGNGGNGGNGGIDRAPRWGLLVAACRKRRKRRAPIGARDICDICDTDGPVAKHRNATVCDVCDDLRRRYHSQSSPLR